MFERTFFFLFLVDNIKICLLGFVAAAAVAHVERKNTGNILSNAESQQQNTVIDTGEEPDSTGLTGRSLQEGDALIAL